MFDEQEVLEEINILNDVPDSLLTVRKNINVLDEENRQKGFPEYPIVTFLGTGSSVPSKYRCNCCFSLITSSSGTDAIKKFTPSLGIPSLGV